MQIKTFYNKLGINYNKIEDDVTSYIIHTKTDDFSYPLRVAGYNGELNIIDWGDGIIEQITGTGAYVKYTHVYSKIGYYTIKIKGKHDGIYTSNGSNMDQPFTVRQALSLSKYITNCKYMFYYSIHLRINDSFKLHEGITNCSHMFAYCGDAGVWTDNPTPIEIKFSLPNSVNTATSMFYNHNALGIICDIGQLLKNWQINKSRTIKDMFYNNSYLYGYAQPDLFWNNSNMTFNSYTFKNCTSLDNYSEIPSNWGGPTTQ